MSGMMINAALGILDNVVMSIIVLPPLDNLIFNPFVPSVNVFGMAGVFEYLFFTSVFHNVRFGKIMS